MQIMDAEGRVVPVAPSHSMLQNMPARLLGAA
jgi:hypothetical protein